MNQRGCGSMSRELLRGSGSTLEEKELLKKDTKKSNSSLCAEILIRKMMKATRTVTGSTKAMGKVI
jgi:hypothetical protein